MKHKRQTLSKTDDEDNKDSLKGDDDSQPCSMLLMLIVRICAIAYSYAFFVCSCILARLEFEEIVSGLRAAVGRHPRLDVKLARPEQQYAERPEQ